MLKYQQHVLIILHKDKMNLYFACDFFAQRCENEIRIKILV